MPPNSVSVHMWCLPIPISATPLTARVHTCQVCHGYTPVVVERELKFLAIPVVEEVMLVPLEAVAAERGFTPLGDKTDEKPN